MRQFKILSRRIRKNTHSIFDNNKNEKKCENNLSVRLVYLDKNGCWSNPRGNHLKNGRYFKSFQMLKYSQFKNLQQPTRGNQPVKVSGIMLNALSYSYKNGATHSLLLRHSETIQFKAYANYQVRSDWMSQSELNCF